MFTLSPRITKVFDIHSDFSLALWLSLLLFKVEVLSFLYFWFTTFSPNQKKTDFQV